MTASGATVTLRFVTALGGLMTGIHPVAVEAPHETTAVELRLDGRTVGIDTEPPWRFDLDLGPELAPHTVEAIARGASDAELDRIHLAVNRPRAEAEAAVDSDGHPLTRLSSGGPAASNGP